MVDIKNVMAVYSGIRGRCCCGCAGKHTYASKYRNMASKHRGYRVQDEEISDRTIKLILNKINRLIQEGKVETVDPEFVSAFNGNRLYIAYFVKKTI